jgi:exodeoxyribonuclease III
MTKQLKIISWNVNGIRAALKKDFAKKIQEINPDILCIQETKASSDQVDFPLTLSHYHKYWHSAKRKGYSGTLIMTKQKPEKIVRGMPETKFNDEGRMLELHFKDFILLNIYFPNGKRDQERLDYKMDYYHAHLKYTEHLRKTENKNIIICGDYNTAHEKIDLARPKENEKISGFLRIERDWMDEYEKHGYIDTFRHFHKDKADEYTWWSMRTRARDRNVGWRIDYFYISTELLSNLKDAFILQDIHGSDHCPLGIVIEV